MSDANSFAKTILLLTNNLLEAADLTEQIEQHAAGSVVILRSAADAMEWWEHKDVAPVLLIFGIRADDALSREVLAMAGQKGCPILMIDGPTGPSDLVTVTRPFSTSDVDRAFRQLRLLS